MTRKNLAFLGRYRNAEALLIVVVACAALSCEQPYDLTSALGGQTLTYSKGPDYTESYVFAADGKSGSYSSESHTYQYPDAASVGDYAKKAWVKTKGWKGTFTYDQQTHQIVFSYAHRFARIPGSSTSYIADYQEYAILDYEKAKNAEASAVSMTRTQKLLFNQDRVENVYLSGAANVWAWTNAYSQVTTIGATTYSYSDLYTDTYTVSATAIAFSGVYDSEEKTDGTLTRTAHEATEETYSVYAFYRLGDTKEEEALADMWKEGGIVTFRANQTSATYKEWEGDTPPTAPTISASTGKGETGTRDADPLSYYSIDNNTYGQEGLTFQHYGTFMTWFSNSANRGLEP